MPLGVKVGGRLTEMADCRGRRESEIRDARLDSPALKLLDSTDESGQVGHFRPIAPRQANRTVQLSLRQVHRRQHVAGRVASATCRPSRSTLRPGRARPQSLPRHRRRETKDSRYGAASARAGHEPAGTAAPGLRAIACLNRRHFSARSSELDSANSAATPKPTISGTGNVPGRSPSSCPPP